MANTIDLDEATFSPTVEGDGIVLVDFWAPWCGPCRMFGPIFDKVAGENPDATFAKVNTQDEQRLGAALGIRAIPTLMVFRDGVLLARQPGLVPEEALRDVLDQVRALDMDEVKKQVAEQQAARA